MDRRSFVFGAGASLLAAGAAAHDVDREEIVYVHGMHVVPQFPGRFESFNSDQHGTALKRLKRVCCFPTAEHTQAWRNRSGDTGLIPWEKPAPWTDVVGYRDETGARFRGGDGNNNTFLTSVPTPVLSDGRRAYVKDVVCLFDLDPGVSVSFVRVMDSDELIVGRGDLFNGVFNGPVSFTSRTSANTLDALADGKAPKPIRFGAVSIRMDVWFDTDGEVLFRGFGVKFGFA